MYATSCRGYLSTKPLPSEFLAKTEIYQGLAYHRRATQSRLYSYNHQFLFDLCERRGTKEDGFGSQGHAARPHASTRWLGSDHGVRRLEFMSIHP